MSHLSPEAHAEMLANRLRKNFRHLKKWARRGEISCFRIYDKDIPEIPLCIDWYNGRLHLAEYARRAPEEICDEVRSHWLTTLIDAVSRELGVEQDEVFVKRRQRQRGSRQYNRVEDRGASFIIVEGGLKFMVNLSDYLDTGLFLDHRMTRDLVRSEAKNKRFLNLFAYTGSFSVYAATGGAVSTTTVDMSRTYLDWAQRNFELNGLLGSQTTHHFIQAEVMRFLELQIDEGMRYDLIVLDPPTFSNSKRMNSHFDIQRHHVVLLHKVLALLAPGGVIYFSTNFKKFKLDVEQFSELVVQDMSLATIPKDFRDKRIHRCYRLQK